MEGFGNAFLEAVYHRKPIFVNNYPVFAYDIRPRGFQVALMEQFITNDVVEEVERFLHDDDYRRQAVDHNYAIARAHYSYRGLQLNLEHIMMEFFGIDEV